MPLHPQVLPMIELLNESMAGISGSGAMEISTMREVPLAPLAENPTAVGDVENRRIPGPGGEIPIRIYTPEASGPLPLVMFFHGGGFVLCSLETHDELCRALCRDTAAVVVSVDYRLAPEARYPAAADDCYAALEWWPPPSAGKRCRWNPKPGGAPRMRRNSVPMARESPWPGTVRVVTWRR